MTATIIKDLANKCAKIMGAEIEEIYEEEIESDAGFSLKNEYSLQYAPYLDKPYLFKFFDGECLIPKIESKTAVEIIEWCENNSGKEEVKCMKIRELKIPEDVEVKLCINGEVEFTFNSEKGREEIFKMGDIEKLKFAIAITAKMALGEEEEENGEIQYSDLEWEEATYGTLVSKIDNYIIYFNQYDDVYTVNKVGEVLLSLLDRVERSVMLDFVNKPIKKVA